MDLALNNLQCFQYHKTQPNQLQKFSLYIYIYICVCVCVCVCVLGPQDPRLSSPAEWEKKCCYVDFYPLDLKKSCWLISFRIFCFYQKHNRMEINFIILMWLVLLFLEEIYISKYIAKILIIYIYIYMCVCVCVCVCVIFLSIRSEEVISFRIYYKNIGN